MVWRSTGDLVEHKKGGLLNGVVLTYPMPLWLNLEGQFTEYTDCFVCKGLDFSSISVPRLDKSYCIPPETPDGRL
jgi:hypothetical protein